MEEDQSQDERWEDDEECSVVRVVRAKPDLVPLVGRRSSDNLDPALRAMGRRPISEFKKPRPIKRDPEKADKNILPDTTTAPKVSRKTMVTRKHCWSHDINGHYLPRMVSSVFLHTLDSKIHLYLMFPKFTKS